MIKKIISLLLIVVMVCSMGITSFATNDYTQGTAVVYNGTGSEAYTITVPAELKPGQSGTVTLSGTWADNRTVTVTADKTVTLTNSIKATDQKVLNVNFAGISEAGDNTAAQTFTKPVSVDPIEAALFGTWSGKFNYNVETETEVVINTPLKFGEKYIITECINTDVLGEYYVFYADGSGESSIDGEMPVGTLTYTATEIIAPDQMAELKMLISSDGTTVTQTMNGETLFILTLESAIESPFPISWNTLEVAENTAVVIDNSIINDLPPVHPEFVKISSAIPLVSQMTRVSVYVEVEGQSGALPFDSMQEDNGAYLIRFSNGSGNYYLVIVPTIGQHFTANFTETGIYAWNVCQSDISFVWDLTIDYAQ